MLRQMQDLGNYFPGNLSMSKIVSAEGLKKMLEEEKEEQEAKHSPVKGKVNKTKIPATDSASVNEQFIWSHNNTVDFNIDS